MRPPSDMPPRRDRRSGARRLRLPEGRARVALIVVLVGLFVLATSLQGIATFYTDYLWFASLDETGVWRGVLGAKVTMVALFTVGFFVLAWVNLRVADGVSGQAARPGGAGDDEVVMRYRELVGRRAGVVRVAVAGLLALAAGGGASSRWSSWVLFRNRVEFGETDATFGRDIGFYVFQLPFLQFVAGWLFSALVVITVVTLVAHYLNGGIRLNAATERVSPAVKAHLSVLLAALALVRTGQYRLDRYQLVYSTRSDFNGATYTDVNVQLPAYDLLVLIALFATVLFLINIRRRGWVLPVIAVGIWGLVAVLAGEAVPALVQRFRVEPQLEAREVPYAENNIAATRAALGLDAIDEQGFAADHDLSAADLARNEETLRNVRLWDPAQVQRTFRGLEGLREYYEIPDVDIDRYSVDGDVQQVMVAPRLIDEEYLVEENRGWEASRLVFTSGYGVVMAPANAKTGRGQPDFVVRGIPSDSVDGYPEVVQPGLYFGEEQDGYKIVDTDQAELRVQDEGGDSDDRSYDGADGVTLSGFVRKAAFSLRFGDVEPLSSGSIRDDSRVLMMRDVRDRVQALAPFLALDGDPYPVVLDGRIVYVLDAYTTTDRYPNAQRVSIDDDLPADSGLRGRSFNYARNSVKATVDAYDGTVTLYVTDDSDPLITAYQRAFPDLFTPIDDADPALVEHFRYPEDLFRVQTVMWGRYHVDDPGAFIQGDNRWEVAAESAAQAETAEEPPAGATDTTSPVDRQETQGRIAPTYQLLRLPGAEQEDFVLLRPFTPRDRPQLSAFLTATPDGRLVSFNVPSGRSPNGPGVAADRMQNEDDIGELRTFFEREGTDVTFGNVLLVPIEESLLYVRSVYVTATADQPQVRAVIVYWQDGTDSDRVAVGNTLSEALEELFGIHLETLEQDPDPEDDIDEALGGGSEETPDDEGPEDEPEPEAPFDGTAAELLVEIQDAFDAADAALADGDLAGYQEHIERAQDLVDVLDQLLSGGAGEGPQGSGPSGDGDAPDDEDADPGGGSGGDDPPPEEGEASPPTTPTTTTRPTA